VARIGVPYLVVAGHAPHKGVELAVDALADLPGYTLVVLTGGQRVDSFTAAAAGSPASDRILFLDRLSDAEYAATVAGAAAFLMPSHFEGYGLPAAEALRLGTPTVISPDPALHEATGGAAIRMDAWTADALARAVAGIGSPPAAMAGAGPGRSWREATGHLFGLLTDESRADRVPAPTLSAD
jgi:glycosyltransferase involved in cell wall biosynthesis